MTDDELVLAWIAAWLDVGDDRCEENGSFSSEFVTPVDNQLLFVDRRQCNECNNGLCSSWFLYLWLLYHALVTVFFGDCHQLLHTCITEPISTSFVTNIYIAPRLSPFL